MPIRNRFSSLISVLGIGGAIGCVAPDLDHEATTTQAVTFNISQAATGGFSPFGVSVVQGDQVVWHFPSASPGNAVARRVFASGRYEIAPYTPSFANEFVGPMITAPSGVFALGPTGNGLTSQSTPCVPNASRIAQRTTGGVTEYLCRSQVAANYQRTMESTWADPSITGVFIRLQWKDLQPTMGTWNDSVLLRETDAAVAHGKLYSIVIESGRDGQPPWLLAPVASGGAGLTGYELDSNDELSAAGVCNPNDYFHYADPTTMAYQTLYKAALTHVADVLKQSSARYRALAYIKPSGANRGTGENRLPTRCKVGAGCICNNQVWAEQAHYAPHKLYTYYADQITHIALTFPGKSMSYMLIQAGFPRVGEDQCWDGAAGAGVTCPPAAVDLTVPQGTEQTEHIIDAALGSLPNGTFIVEHQGLDMDPASVNWWVTSRGMMFGTPTMFQTSAGGQVGSPADVGDTLQNLWTNSNASALEIYEERLWEANGAALGGAANPTHTIGQWNVDLHARRRLSYPVLGDPAPTTYRFTIGAPVLPGLPPPLNFENDMYIDPRHPVLQGVDCANASSPCIHVF